MTGIKNASAYIAAASTVVEEPITSNYGIIRHNRNTLVGLTADEIDIVICNSHAYGSIRYINTRATTCGGGLNNVAADRTTHVIQPYCDEVEKRLDTVDIVIALGKVWKRRNRR
jgi:hypothetical protein